MTNIRIHFLTLLIGFSQIYAWATTYYLPAALGETLALEFGQSFMSVIGGFSWALLIGGLSSPKIGAWIESEGGRRPLALGNFLMGLGLLVLSQSHELMVWYIGWTVVGLGMALGLFNAIFATIGRLMGQDSKKIIIRVTLISGFATLFWPITTYLMQTVGWRSMLVIYAIPHLLIWCPLYYVSIPKTVPIHVDGPVSEHQVGAGKIKFAFYLLASYAIVRSVVGTGISVNILSMFEGLGLSVATAALVAALIGPSQIVGRLIEMYFGCRLDPMYSSIFWTIVLPVASMGLVLIGPSFASFFAIAYGMSNGVLTITMGILPMILFGSKGYATLLGRLAMPVLIAQAITPLLTAPMMESWQSETIFIWVTAVGILAALCLIKLSCISKQFF